MPPPPNRRTTLEQEAFLYGLSRRYYTALRELKVDAFWKNTFDEWFLRWPVVPGLIERGLLPPEAANYRFTPEQKRVVNAEMDPIIDIIMETMNNMLEKWLDIKRAKEQRKEWDDFWENRHG